MAELAPVIKQRFFDSNGDPLVGGKLYSYIAGTSTPKATYSDSSGATANTNPVILDANGECDIWIISGSYKFVLDNVSDVNQWTRDNVPTVSALISTAGALAVLNNLSDLNSAATALTNLGLTATATELNYTDGVTSNIQTQLDAKTTDLTAHTGDATDAHAASAITNTPSGNLAATEIQAAVNELQTDIDTRALASGLTDHTSDATDAHAASAITNTPSGNLAAITAQTALNELQTDIDTRALGADLTAHTGNTSNPHTVTATQVGNTTAQWNADQIQGQAMAVPHASSMLDVQSTAKGSRPFPRVTEAERDAIASPVSGLIVYNTDSDALNLYSSAAWAEISGSGGAGGAGGINHIDADSANFETTIGSWVTYKDTAAVTPVDGIDGTATVISLSLETASPLRGEGSLLITKTAANGQGEGASVAFSVDPQDAANGQNWGYFDFETSANYVTDDLLVFIYDVTNSSLITPRRTSTNTRTTFSVPLNSSSTSYRLIIHCAATHEDAFTVKVDNVRVGPDTPTPTAIITPWESWTPTGGFTNTTYTGKKRRVGDTAYIEVHGSLTGTPSAAALTINISSIGTIDTTKIITTNTDNPLDSNAVMAIAADPGPSVGCVTYTNSTTVALEYQTANTTNVELRPVTQAVPATWASGDYFIAKFSVPIEGWDSGNVLSSQEILHKTAKVRAYRSAVQSVTNSTSSKVNLNAKTFDDLNLFDNSTNYRFTAAKSGFYFVKGSVNWSPNATGVRGALIFVNGGSVAENYQQANASNFITATVSDLIKLEAGDYVELYGYQDSGGSLNITSGSTRTYLFVEARPDFTVFGNLGVPYEREETEITANTSTTLADTWLDVTGSSFTIAEAGTFNVGYDASILVENTSGSASSTLYGQVGLFDSSDVQAGPTALVGGHRAATSFATYPVSRQTEITQTTSKTYKLRIKCGVASATGYARFCGTSVTGALTNPDNNSVVWYRRTR